MRGLYRLGWWGLLLSAAIAATGCSKHDTERLARLSQKISARMESIGDGATCTLHGGWQGFRAHQDDGGIDARVASRLRWDKELADTRLQVEAETGTVTLKGKVENLAQRQRAVALAESTTGVEKVIDELKLPEEEK
jgi:hyperosmotically inducible protein